MRRTVFLVAFSAPSCMVGIALLQGCLAPAPTDSADAGVDASNDASQSTSDSGASSDAPISIACDSAPPSAPFLQVQCLDDGGTCKTPSTICCQTGATFDCQASCVGGFECDKASDCSSGNICCATLSKPDTSKCPASSTTTAGTTCTTASSCGIGQLELCVVGQACADSTKTCKAVNVDVNAGAGFVIGHRMLGACY